MKGQNEPYVRVLIAGLLLLAGVLLWALTGFEWDESRDFYLLIFPICFVSALVDCLPASRVRLRRGVGATVLVVAVAICVRHFALDGPPFRWKMIPLHWGPMTAPTVKAIDLHDVLVNHWDITLIVIYLPLLLAIWFGYEASRKMKK